MPDLFNHSTLEMSTEPLRSAVVGVAWSDILVNRIAVIAFIVLLLVEFNDLVRLYPQLLRCLSRWKGNMEMEHSVSLARTRNTVAFVHGFAFCLVADRYALLSPSFRALVPIDFRLFLTLGLVLAAFLLRRLLYLVSRFRSNTAEFALTLRHTPYNYLILLSNLVLVSVVLMGAFHVPDNAVRTVILAETILFYLIHLISIRQILASRCGSFITILYLCALEILPFGILFFTCTR